MSYRSSYYPSNRYHAPLREKTADELALAIAKGQHDSGACRAELIRQGWTDEMIEVRVAEMAGLVARIKAAR